MILLIIIEYYIIFFIILEMIYIPNKDIILYILQYLNDIKQIDIISYSKLYKFKNEIILNEYFILKYIKKYNLSNKYQFKKIYINYNKDIWNYFIKNKKYFDNNLTHLEIHGHNSFNQPLDKLPNNLTYLSISANKISNKYITLENLDDFINNN